MHSPLSPHLNHLTFQDFVILHALFPQPAELSPWPLETPTHTLRICSAVTSSEKSSLISPSPSLCSQTCPTALVCEVPQAGPYPSHLFIFCPGLAARSPGRWAPAMDGYMNDAYSPLSCSVDSDGPRWPCINPSCHSRFPELS